MHEYYCIDYATLNNQGKVAETAGNAFYVRPPATINNSGSWTLNSDVNVIADQGAVVFSNTGSLVKSGGTATTGWQVPIQNSGSLVINTGTLVLTSYSQSASGSYTSNISGSTCNAIGSIAVSGAATLAGALDLLNTNGCSPSNGTAFTVMTFKSVSGQFATHSSGWNVSYTATTVVATFEGGGGQPVVTLTPTKLTFATQVVDTLSKAKTIKVANTGTATLTITNVAISGANAGDFSESNNCSSVNAGASCTVSVKFKPANDGSRSATLTLTDNAGSGTQTVPLAGVGTFLSVTPNPIAFPSQLLNTTSAQTTITLQNVNPSTSVTISGIVLKGTDAGDFTENSTCGVIPANGTCSFTMTFTPSAVGKRAATLDITDNAGGSPQKIKVSGLGTYVTLAPSPVSFGTVAVGKTSSTTVTLTNHNPAAAVSVSAVSISGADKKDFTASASAGCSSVAANGGTCSIMVNFKPTATGARSGILSVKDNDEGSPQTDNLTGTGQ